MTRPRAADVGAHLFLGALAFIPLLRTQPGIVGADTKQYLYLDPARLMSRAGSVWDPSIGMGTVTHQNVGYLWPMGPWYRLFDALGAPDWVAQRLWLATLLFAAGAGTLLLLRVLGMRGTGALIAALSYMLTPYILSYAARITAILLPWAGLPWLIAWTVLALRRGGWRYPAAIALLVTTIGSINASSLLYAAIAAGCWIPFAIWHLHEVEARAAARTVTRIGVLCAVTQLWWLVPLILSGRYGPPVLQSTESIEAISTSSLTTEVARSLGNWFFYGRDAIGPWVSAAVPYEQEGWLMVVSFLVPILAFASAGVVRWTHRAYFIALILIGAVIAVAAHPFADPSPLGTAYKSLAGSSSFALALRNAQRATPLLALGMAVLLGMGVHAAARRVPRGAVLVGGAVGLLVLANLPALWQGTLVDANLSRPEQLPGYNEQAARYLDGDGDATRVLEIPGTDFASYRWGTTVDPIMPGLMGRPWIGREAAPQGTVGSINLVTALDHRMQEGTFEPSSLAAVARFMAAGDVLLRSDLQYERYRTPQPRTLWRLLREGPAGLGAAVPFGAPVPNRAPSTLPLIDAQALGTPSSVEEPAPLIVFPVTDDERIGRAKPAKGVVLLDGDGEGLVDAAAQGLVAGHELVLYGGTATLNRTAFDRAVAGGATIVVSDTNRRRAQRFLQLRENFGFTEQPGEVPLRRDVADARLDLFPSAGDDARTVTVLRGVQSVRATSYGNTVTYIPEHRPTLALDGDTTTAWRAAAFTSSVGERLRIVLSARTAIEHLDLTQPLTGDRNRWITKVGVRLDGGAQRVVELTDASRAESGQRLDLPSTRATTVELEILADNVGKRSTYDGYSAVGFAEVGIPGVQMTEWVRPPTTVLSALGDDSADHRLVLLFSRLRADPGQPDRADAEPIMARTFSLPTARSFNVGGTARISDQAPDPLVDQLLGLPDATSGGITATSSGRLPGSLASRASSAFDGDPATAWVPPIGDQIGGFVEVTLAQPTIIDHLDLRLVDDGHHSVPTELTVRGDGGDERTVAVPAGGGVVRFPAFGARTVRVTVDGFRQVTATNWFDRSADQLPVGIAELGIAGAVRPRLPEQLPATCRPLVEVDGASVGVVLDGSPRTAEARAGNAIRLCTIAPLVLDGGDHDLLAAAPASTGIDVDRLALTSPASGDVEATLGPAVAAPLTRPRVRTSSPSRSSMDLTVANATRPFWLVLGQSMNDQWSASLEGGDGLGPPTLVDGYANGWYIDPRKADPDGDGAFVVHASWRPQRLVRSGINLSSLGALICIAFVAFGGRRRGDPLPVAHEPELVPVWQQPSVVGLVPAVVASLATGLVATIVIGITAGPLLAAGALLVLLEPRARPLLIAGSVVTLAGSGAFVVIQQMRHGYPFGFSWAGRFDRLHQLGWIALALLALDAVVEVLAAHPHPSSLGRLRSRFRSD